MSERDVVLPAGRQSLWKDRDYLPAIRIQRFSLVSGSGQPLRWSARSPSCKPKSGLAFDNLNAILSVAGCTFGDVVDVTVFYRRSRVEVRNHLEVVESTGAMLRTPHS